MILEDGTDEQLKRCAEQAMLPRNGEYWRYTNRHPRTPLLCTKDYEVLLSRSSYEQSVWYANLQAHQLERWRDVEGIHCREIDGMVKEVE